MIIIVIVIALQYLLNVTVLDLRLHMCPRNQLYRFKEPHSCHSKELNRIIIMFTIHLHIMQHSIHTINTVHTFIHNDLIHYLLTTTQNIPIPIEIHHNSNMA